MKGYSIRVFKMLPQTSANGLRHLHVVMSCHFLKCDSPYPQGGETCQ
jgi:hypothetical protein